MRYFQLAALKRTAATTEARSFRERLDDRTERHFRRQILRRMARGDRM
jgi:hypothetical protein